MKTNQQVSPDSTSSGTKIDLTAIAWTGLAGLVLAFAVTAHSEVPCDGRIYGQGLKTSGPPAGYNVFLPCWNANGVPTPPGCYFHPTPLCWADEYSPDDKWYGFCDNTIRPDQPHTDAWCHDNWIWVVHVRTEAMTYTCVDGSSTCQGNCADFTVQEPENLPLNQPYLNWTTDSGDECAQGG